MQLVEELRYKPEGRGFDSRWCRWNPSGRIIALGSTQRLTEMSSMNISWGYTWSVSIADNVITFICRLQ